MATFDLTQVLAFYRRAWFGTSNIVKLILENGTKNLVPAAPYVWGEYDPLYLAVVLYQSPDEMPALFNKPMGGASNYWVCTNYRFLADVRFSDAELVEFAAVNEKIMGDGFHPRPYFTAMDTMTMYTANYPALKETVTLLRVAGVRHYPAILDVPSGFRDRPDTLTIFTHNGFKFWVEPINGRPGVYEIKCIWFFDTKVSYTAKPRITAEELAAGWEPF